MNYKFQNLLGGSYRGGNLVLRGKELHSATGNRIVLVSVSADKLNCLDAKSLLLIWCP